MAKCKYIILFLLSGCASTSAEITIGPALVDGGMYPGHGIVANIRVKRHLTEKTWCEWSHSSYVFEGPPFGPRNEEDSLDVLACGMRFGGQ